MKIKRPTGNRILVEPIAASDHARGLFIPENSRDVSSEGIVVSVGPGKANDKGIIPEPIVKVGDRVYFERYGGIDVKVDEKPFKLLNPNELLAIIE